MILRTIKILCVTILMSLLYACNYNSSVMMRTDKDYEFDQPPSDEVSEYIISKSDIIELALYTNDGTSLIDLTAISENRNQLSIEGAVDYLVEYDGHVKLPIIGRVLLMGKTIKEAENFLEAEYSKYYIKPFVKLSVTNRRITVFPGGGSKGQVIPLMNENVTMLEALGHVGGLTSEAKAYKIKLIRGDLKNPQVYMFDFSTLEGVKQADFVLQANDIIYVEKRNEALRELLRDVAPVVSLITSTVTLIVVLNNLN